MGLTPRSSTSSNHHRIRRFETKAFRSPVESIMKAGAATCVGAVRVDQALE